MKKLIYVFVILLFSLGSCEMRGNKNYHHSKQRTEPTEKYPIGMIIYLKPDSTKAVIVAKSNCGCYTNKYRVNYADKNGVYQETTVLETSIY